jgi:iron uptake system component EfeO
MSRASHPAARVPAAIHRHRLVRSAPVLLAIALLVSACGTSSSSKHAASATATAVNITLTPQGCAPKPAQAPAGEIEVNVANKDAGAVSEAELRTSDLSHLLGEQENLTPGLSGGFVLNLQPGHYVVNCPGAAQRHWTFVVSGKASGPDWSATPALVTAVNGYSAYVNQNVGGLVTSTQGFCAKIDAGNLADAKLAYAKARVYYERIEPVAEIWGALDTEIDGRWENPVTVASQFVGFHRIEQLLWEQNTLAGARSLCAELVKHEQQLLTLVRAATYNPLEMVSGGTDLIDEAATAKVTGEEERYSNTDLVVLQANIDGAQEVVNLLHPYLQSTDPALLASVNQRYAAATKLVNGFKASPGYENTGYVEYSTVLEHSRRRISGALNAYAESLSQLSAKVS